MQKTGDHSQEVAAGRIFETEMERIRTTAKDADREVGLGNAVKKGSPAVNERAREWEVKESPCLCLCLKQKRFTC